jgi:hypothetical protein
MARPTRKQEQSSETTMVKVARAIGTGVGKLAALAGETAGPEPASATSKQGKLPKKGKQRVPRRLKKKQQKAVGRPRGSVSAHNK